MVEIVIAKVFKEWSSVLGCFHKKTEKYVDENTHY